MANPSDVLYKLQGSLSKYFVDNKIRVNSKIQVNRNELDEDIMNEFGLSPSHINNFAISGTNTNNDVDNNTDIGVDNAQSVDSPMTNTIDVEPADADKAKRIKVELNYIFEQPEDEIPPQEEMPPEGTEEQQPQEEMQPQGGEMDPSMSTGGMDPSMDPSMAGGMGGEAKKPSVIGRIYELKKIYTRLTTIESYLSDTSDTDLLRIRMLVSKAIELFEILASNITSYRPPIAKHDTLDEIIVVYYTFLDRVYDSVAKHFKKKKSELMQGDTLKQVVNTLSKR